MKPQTLLLIVPLCSLCSVTPLPGAQTLREAAGDRLLVGCAVATRDLSDPRLAALVTEQFSCLTPECEFMPEKLVDDAGRFTFEAGDRVVAFAEAHHLPVFGHMLVWHFVTRKWLFESPDGQSATITLSRRSHSPRPPIRELSCTATTTTSSFRESSRRRSSSCARCRRRACASTPSASRDTG
ncbi:MAG: endo-1,4-beta-xylanase [Armatimonadetes bacterium]|nr:endo-1,4-beta-xylanase [Armatimonadota bacterium]NCP30547.1 endo-1,4-beta-xylanase [Armatimonadota bacterium]NCQ29424.1 endo-1,4-beta-xylanase [Armatimonadota bacterium]PIU94114.1 MAG: hypothetical protein COS65_09215 [Armatimonadetes bacterium CG06_land_8_20_14_3_00_66_21]